MTEQEKLDYIKSLELVEKNLEKAYQKQGSIDLMI